jgi:hypothetical protein
MLDKFDIHEVSLYADRYLSPEAILSYRELMGNDQVWGQGAALGKIYNLKRKCR